MCFSNLPVEFDEDGNPYLADEAEDVSSLGCDCDDDAGLDEDPKRAYDAIVDAMPDHARDRVEGTVRPDTDTAEVTKP